MKKGFIKKTSPASKILLSSIIFATTGFIGVSLASVSSPIYSPGETLSPTCSPGEENCGVSMNLDSLTNVKDITEQDNDLLFYDTNGWNRLGHGTDGQVLKYTTDSGLGWGNSGLDGIDILENGNVGIGISTPSKKLDISGDGINLENTTFAFQNGIIYKNGTPFIHNFNYGNNGTVTTDGYNIFVGENSGNLTMGSDASWSSDASYNIGIGTESLNSNTTGSDNVAIGYQSLYSNTIGIFNTAIGNYVLYDNTEGDGNVGLGDSSLRNNTTGNYNIGIGFSSLQLNTTGYGNMGIGNGALNLNETGIGNASLGSLALAGNISGNFNIAIGTYAGKEIAGTTGDPMYQETFTNNLVNSSIYLGALTKASANGNNNEIVIGYDATGLGSNTVVLGNDSIITTALRGNVGIGTTTPTYKLEVAGNAKFDSTVEFSATNETPFAKFPYSSGHTPEQYLEWGTLKLYQTHNNALFIKPKELNQVVGLSLTPTGNGRGAYQIYSSANIHYGNPGFAVLNSGLSPANWYGGNTSESYATFSTEQHADPDYPITKMFIGETEGNILNEISFVYNNMSVTAMTIKEDRIDVNVDLYTDTLNVTELLNAPRLESDPTEGIIGGSIYFNTGDNKLKVYNGSIWQDLN
ncbi:hypothetical protein K9L04_00560 [Patescibacteria group bacterium]|nr:hypothetical protein [Patescibacteria group bacterium]